jgi:WD40 repeat protein
VDLIFISYRRKDSDVWADRLARELRQHFNGCVFLDIRAIAPGLPWRKVLDDALDNCAALLVVIGNVWLNAADSEGRRRLDDPNDTLRWEIAAALRRGVRVFPLLVDGATMPMAQHLPDELKDLVGLQGQELTVKHWDEDVAKLVAILKQVPGLNGAQLEQSKLRTVPSGEARSPATTTTAMSGQSIPKTEDAHRDATRPIWWKLSALGLGILLVWLGAFGIGKRFPPGSESVSTPNAPRVSEKNVGADTPSTPTGRDSEDESNSNRQPPSPRPKTLVLARKIAQLELKDVIKELSPCSLRVRFSWNRKLLVSRHEGGELRLWDVSTGKPIREPEALDELMTYGDPAFSSDGRSLIFPSSEKSITVLDLASGNSVRTINVALPNAHVSAANFDLSRDDKIFALGGRPGTLWDFRSGALIGRLPHTKDEDTGVVALSPDGKVLATNHLSGLRLWSVPNLQPIDKPPPGESPFVFSPDGKTLVTGYRNIGWLGWDLASNKPKFRNQTPGEPLRALAFTPDSKILVTISLNRYNAIRFWELENQALIAEPFGSADGISFSPDGKLVAFAGGRCNIWELAL